MEIKISDFERKKRCTKCDAFLVVVMIKIYEKNWNFKSLNRMRKK